MKGDLQKIRGVNKAIEPIVLEILDTGSSAYYEKLLLG
jgi:DNA polymerase/3'-5' exonuclease PolX